MPAWRVRARQALAPYRRLLSALMLPILVLPFANDLFHWGLFGEYDRKSLAIAPLIGLVWYVFVAPTWEEVEEMRAERNAKRNNRD